MCFDFESFFSIKSPRPLESFHDIPTKHIPSVPSSSPAPPAPCRRAAGAAAPAPTSRSGRPSWRRSRTFPRRCGGPRRRGRARSRTACFRQPIHIRAVSLSQSNNIRWMNFSRKAFEGSPAPVFRSKPNRGIHLPPLGMPYHFPVVLFRLR